MIKQLVPLSGGKDSQATLIWACEKFGAKNITAVFCDTKWEHPLTYSHIQYLCETLGVELVVLTSQKYDGFVGLSKTKKRFPASKSKFCTTELKVIPMIDYVLSLNCHVIIYQGIRADESENRSQMEQQCTYFKYYYEPYQTNTMIVNSLSGKEKLSRAQKDKLKKALARLAIGKDDPKYHTYRKKDVFAFREKYVDDVERPFFYATADDVIRFSLNREIMINPLYFKGFSRVGCFPCIMCTVNEIDLIIKDFPEIIEKIKAAEKYVGGTLFKPDKVPKKYRKGFDTKSNTAITSIDDVVRYRADKNATGDLFKDDKELNGCKSVYSICE